jgi:hypothetical protein
MAIEEELEQLKKTNDELQLKATELEKIKTQMADEQKKKEALELETKRQQELLDKTRTQKQSEQETVVGKLREENLQKARNLIIEKFKLEGDSIKALDDKFKKTDSGAITPENIYEDLEEAYASINRKKLLKAQEEMENRSQAGSDFVAQQSTDASLGIQPSLNTESVQLDKTDEWVIRNNPRFQTPEGLQAYKRLKAAGKI